VFESGLDIYGSLSWVKVHESVAQFTRACTYSRAGIIWSDDKDGFHDGLGVARDLHATLAAAGERGPFVLVGHSLGGPYITIYTKLFGDEVVGLVYVDASQCFNEAVWQPAERARPTASTADREHDVLIGFQIVIMRNCDAYYCSSVVGHLLLLPREYLRRLSCWGV
jgi:pimeloyl-ACP methyl ester carboxylesterase